MRRCNKSDSAGHAESCGYGERAVYEMDEVESEDENGRTEIYETQLDIRNPRTT